MTDLFSSPDVVVSAVAISDVGFTPRYALTNLQGEPLGTAAEPAPRRFQKLIPIMDPKYFRFRLGVCDTAGNPLFSIDKRYRYQRVEAQVTYPDGSLAGTVKTSPLDPRRRRFRLTDVQRGLVGEAYRSTSSDFEVLTPAGVETARITGRPRGARSYLRSLPSQYRIVFMDQPTQPLRTLTIALPLILDLSRN